MSNKYRIIFRTPQKFCVQNVKYFLENIECIFEMENQHQSGVFFDVYNTEKVDILGLLLIYKFLNYTVKKHCFVNPITNLRDNKEVSGMMKKIGFEKLVDENFTIKNPDETKANYSVSEGLFIAPIVLRRDGCESINKVEKKIKDYYKENEISSSILQCIGELSSNFQEHAVEDTQSVLVARGNKDYIEIACADNGEGIISSLNSTLKEKYNNGYDVIRRSIEENVTSKPDGGHMGCGLWIVNQYVTATKGVMYIYSQNGYLKNNEGKIKCGESPFWKGTIIYIKMPLKNKEPFTRVMYEKEKNIELNYKGIELKFI